MMFCQKVSGLSAPGNMQPIPTIAIRSAMDVPTPRAAASATIGCRQHSEEYAWFGRQLREFGVRCKTQLDVRLKGKASLREVRRNGRLVGFVLELSAKPKKLLHKTDI